MGGAELTDKSCPWRPRFVANGPILVAGRDHSTTDRSGNAHPGQYAIGGHQIRNNGLNGNGRIRPRRLDRPLHRTAARAHWKRWVACFSVVM